MNNPYGDFLVHEPQLVHAEPKKKWDDPIYKEKIIGTVKEDGSYYRLVKENNQVFLFSRTISKKTGFYAEKINNVPHIKKWAEKYLPNGTCIIGEIYYPGGQSKDTTTVMGCLPQKAVEVQEDKGNIHFYIHDILKYNGYDYVANSITYDRRYSDICKYIDIQTPLIEEIEVAQCIDNTYCDLRKITEQYLHDGEEGMVFRLENSLYVPGKRPSGNTWKVKQHEDSLDFVILHLLKPEKEYTGKELSTWHLWETKDGRKIYVDKDSSDFEDCICPVTKDYYYGWYNAFSIGAYDENGKLITIGRVSSGLTDQDKISMTQNPDEWVGTVCSISCMSVDKENKTVRHPAFVAHHPAKDTRECRIKEIFG